MTGKDKKEIVEAVNEIRTDLDAIRAITVSDVAMQSYIKTCCRKILQILKKDDAENILPRPVIRDGNGRFTKLYSTRDWFMKLQEEIFEVMETIADGKDDIYDEYIAEEIADIITVCISYLNALGYDEEKRSEIFRKVNEKNGKRGYFKETDSNGD